MLPELLQSALDPCFENVPLSELKRQADRLSHTYRKGEGSLSVFESDLGALAYLATRMPATFGAVDAVLREVGRRLPDWEGKSLLDLGSGPGTAAWAAVEQFPSLLQTVLWDQSRKAIQWGKKLAAAHPVLSRAEWIHGSIDSVKDLPKADLAICSYALTELLSPSGVIDALWKSETPLIVIVEPGTPVGFQTIRTLRDQWMRLGGHLIAPCPHELACPMAKGDWCHFSARIARTRRHRLLKEGELGYEDEKFSYFVGSRFEAQKVAARILRHPIKQKGHVRLSLCMESGVIQEKNITRKDPRYREARDAEWGDRW